MGAEIVIREGQGYVNGLPPEVIEPLNMATSFKPAGYQFTKAYQLGKSDGRVKLLKHSKFPAGLIAVVTGVLDSHDVDYTLDIEQGMGEKADLPPYELVDIQDRWYQNDAVEAAMLNPRGKIRAPTGSGKTAIGARIIVGRGKWAVIVVPTIDLLHQYRKFLHAHLRLHGEPVHIGQLGDGVVDPQPITVATAKTAAKAVGVAYSKSEFAEYDDSEQDTNVSPSKLREWIEALGTLIVDEAHILGADTVYHVATKIPCPNKYGMSASPWRDDGADLMIEAATGTTIYKIPTKVLVDEGFLVPPIIQVVDTQGWWNPASWGATCTKCDTQRAPFPHHMACVECGNKKFRSEFTEAYRKEIVENVRRNTRIAELTNRYTEPTLVLVKQVKHGRLLEPMLRDSRFLSGKDLGRERAQAFQEIRDGQLRVLIATTIADMGLDIPALTNLILAGGGKSSTRHLQRIGRVTRTHPGKTVARVVDFDDGHVHKWFREHAKARRKIEQAEWGESALWI